MKTRMALAAATIAVTGSLVAEPPSLPGREPKTPPGPVPGTPMTEGHVRQVARSAYLWAWPR
jgi:hypothetical protein